MDLIVQRELCGVGRVSAVYDPRFDKLADVLVDYSLDVKEGDVVVVKAPFVAEPLTIAVTKRLLKAGAHPVLRCYPEELEELLCKLGKGKQLTFISPSDKLDMETADCLLVLWASVNTRAMTNVDPKAQQLRSKARKPILDTFMRRTSLSGRKAMRWVGTMFPCQASAQDADMSLSDYADFVFRAGLLHLPNPAAAWRKVRTAQQRVCDFLDKAKEIRFVSKSGTDLTLGIEGRKWINCYGSDNFPDGEVFTGPIENATRGVVKFDFPAVYGGREVTDVVLVFKNGKVVDASATKNEDYLFKMMDQDKGARILGEIAIGTNYSIKRYTKNTLFDEKIGGTFHAAIGSAYPASGGKNVSALHWDMVCDMRPGGCIEVDGKVIARNGRFVKDGWPKPSRRM